MTRQLVFATGNENKVKEVQQMLDGAFEIMSLHSLGCFEELPETTGTIDGNARQKAFYIFERYGFDCFAEDTGLEIRALNWQPGVHSARFAGDQKDSEANILKVLAMMEGLTDRSARFRTVMVLIIQGQIFTFEGIIEGEITTTKSGKDGFGYDPIFQPSGYEQTFAEMGEEEKNKISHRAMATNKMLAFLKLNF